MKTMHVTALRVHVEVSQNNASLTMASKAIGSWLSSLCQKSCCCCFPLRKWDLGMLSNSTILAFFWDEFVTCDDSQPSITQNFFCGSHRFKKSTPRKGAEHVFKLKMNVWKLSTTQISCISLSTWDLLPGLAGVMIWLRYDFCSFFLDRISQLLNTLQAYTVWEKKEQLLCTVFVCVCVCLGVGGGRGEIPPGSPHLSVSEIIH